MGCLIELKEIGELPAACGDDCCISTEKNGLVTYTLNVRADLIELEGDVRQLTGYKEYELRNLGFRRFLEQVHPQDRKKMIVAHSYSVRTGQKFREEYRLLRKDGKYLNVEDTGKYTISKEGRIPMVRGVLKEVTGKKSNRKALEKLKI